MDLRFTAEDEQFRTEVQDFLASKLTPDMREATRRTTTVFADKALAMRWQKILVEKGWAVPAWPKEYGGTDWTPTQKYVFGEECAKARAPGLIPLDDVIGSNRVVRALPVGLDDDLFASAAHELALGCHLVRPR